MSGRALSMPVGDVQPTTHVCVHGSCGFMWGHGARDYSMACRPHGCDVGVGCREGGRGKGKGGSSRGSTHAAHSEIRKIEVRRKA
jgi:hypothetical protein